MAKVLQYLQNNSGQGLDYSLVPEITLLLYMMGIDVVFKKATVYLEGMHGNIHEGTWGCV